MAINEDSSKNLLTLGRLFNIQVLIILQSNDNPTERPLYDCKFT
jgi:hypothetical protein